MQKDKRSGLPDSLRMRHDTHFVDLISARTPGPRVRMIPLEMIDPNPQQARSELGNIKELTASVRSRGVLEPILVRPKGGRYEIIAGERRYIASKNVGLKEIPCIEMNVPDNEAMELALVENLQRKDLDVFEEADGLKALVGIYGYTHNKISEKIGKARSTITEIIDIAKIPKSLREACTAKGLASRSMLIEIAKMKTVEEMKRLIDEISEKKLTREDTRDLTKMMKGKVKKLSFFVYNYAPKNKGKDTFRLRIEFKKQQVSKQEIIEVLEEILNKLKAQAE